MGHADTLEEARDAADEALRNAGWTLNNPPTFEERARKLPEVAQVALDWLGDDATKLDNVWEFLELASEIVKRHGVKHQPPTRTREALDFITQYREDIAPDFQFPRTREALERIERIRRNVTRGDVRDAVVAETRDLIARYRDLDSDTPYMSPEDAARAETARRNPPFALLSGETQVRVNRLARQVLGGFEGQLANQTNLQEAERAIERAIRFTPMEAEYLDLEILSRMAPHIVHEPHTGQTELRWVWRGSPRTP